ncbi:hypothetical protein MKHDV_01239 [Halodesulfovibrio sp. MK-HDV]|nr:hypothetical protein MKHDV_01239 [Halodesulfovibrio sp. MK-HDV]
MRSLAPYSREETLKSNKIVDVPLCNLHMM